MMIGFMGHSLKSALSLIKGIYCGYLQFSMQRTDNFTFDFPYAYVLPGQCAELKMPQDNPLVATGAAGYSAVGSVGAGVSGAGVSAMDVSVVSSSVFMFAFGLLTPGWRENWWTRGELNPCP